MSRHPIKRAEFAALAPDEFRARCRSGEWTAPTPGCCDGFEQANLVILPAAYADEFAEFCHSNAQACPLLERTAPGDPLLRNIASRADVRTDLPRYQLLEGGAVVGEATDLSAHWCADSVAFLLGCSFTFDAALLGAGLPVRHVELGTNVPMYRSDRRCIARGMFDGPLVVSMRPMLPELVERATAVTSAFPRSHGAPVHVGDPAALGIDSLAVPDFGDPVPLLEGEVPVFWACGVTSQEVVRRSGIARVATHAPGHMLITDLRSGV